MRTIDDIKRSVRISDEIGRRISLKKAGRHHKACCPFHAERTPSFYVSDAKASFRCYGCGARGDVIDFVMQFDGLDLADAVAALGGQLAHGPEQRRAAEEARQRRQREREALEAADRAAREADARGLWGMRRDPTGTVVERYFAARGILWPKLPPTIGLLPSFPYWWQADGWPRPRVIDRLPVMIAAVQDVRGRIVAVHLTYLRPDGGGKAALRCPVSGEPLAAKKVRGSPWGGAIRLAPSPAPEEEHGLAEGIETGASVMQAMDWRLAVWAAVSLGNLCGGGLGFGPRHPVRLDGAGRPVRLPSPRPDMARPGVRLPDSSRRVLILADADGKDPPATEMQIRRAARRFAAEGRATRVAWPDIGKDFNDMSQDTRRNAA